LKSATELAKLAPKKFLGMKQGVGLAVFGIGTTALILGGLYVYKRYVATA